MDVELARQHWNDGNRRVEATRRDRSRHARQLRYVELVLGGLRRRVGQTFTLKELAEVYDRADAWVPDLLDDAEPDEGPVSEPGTITDAAFHHYARGAMDYRP
jgi:hypothetical protein